MLGTAAGGDRQSLHEVVRKHSLAVAEAVSRGEPNTLLERLGVRSRIPRRAGGRAPGRARPRQLHRTSRPAGGRVHRGVPPAAAQARPAARRRSRAGRGEGMKPGAGPSDATLAESRLPLPLLRRGKVREVYEVDAGHLLVVASDRVSAFDVVMREPIPRKGAVLTQISAFWFELLADVFPSHYVTARTQEILERVPRLDGLRGADRRPGDAGSPGRAGALRVCRPRLPLGIGLGGIPEPGHAGRRAAARRPGRKRAPRSAALLAGHQGGERATISTSPSTPWPQELGSGAGRPASASQLCALPGGPRSRRVARDHHRRHQVRVRDRRRRAPCALIDEVLTPDSSRFWPADRYAPGRTSAQLRQAAAAGLSRLAQGGGTAGTARPRHHRCRPRWSRQPAAATSRPTGC